MKQQKQDDCPACFGNASSCNHLPACKPCAYTESCQYCAENPQPGRYSRDSKGHHVSLDAYQYAEEVAAVADDTGADDAAAYEAPIYSNADMQRLTEFFLRGVDDYTLAIVECVLRDNLTTASQVAEAFDVSREAMHRKIVDSCRQYPYLREMLRCALYRCKILSNPENRATIAKRRVKTTKTKELHQMEFTFNAKP